LNRSKVLQNLALYTRTLFGNHARNTMKLDKSNYFSTPRELLFGSDSPDIIEVRARVILCLIALLLVAVAALRLGRLWKARSVLSFWW
jgi:hypothetical protein